MTFTPEQIKLLEAPLDPKHVKKAPQGKYGDYIEGHHAISEANRIFGHGGWSYTITMLEMCSRCEAKNGEQIRVGYRCTVLVSVNGVQREGAAVGSGISKPENEYDAHESAVKEAETDALKRALRSFGNTLGLALYDKTKANVQEPEPEVPASVEMFLKGLRESYDEGTAETYWKEHWPTVPKDWRQYALDQKEQIKAAHGKAELMRA